VESVNLALRFLLELGALASLAYWGWQTRGSVAVRILLTVVTPLVAALIWGRFVGPKASHRLEDPVRAAVEIGFFGGAAVALLAAGATTIGVVFAIAAAVSLVLMFLFGQRGM